MNLNVRLDAGGDYSSGSRLVILHNAHGPRCQNTNLGGKPNRTTLHCCSLHAVQRSLNLNSCKLLLLQAEGHPCAASKRASICMHAEDINQAKALPIPEVMSRAYQTCYVLPSFSAFPSPVEPDLAQLPTLSFSPELALLWLPVLACSPDLATCLIWHCT